MGDGLGPRLEGHTGHGDGDGGRPHTAGPVTEAGAVGGLADALCGGREQDGRDAASGAAKDARRTADRNGDGGSPGPWSNPDWLPCRDGKARPVEPGTFPLAHGAPARVGRLRAYGNAIVPQVAAAFVTAFIEATS
jgi:DNA (cytosine-5)-methyltransferase 1